MQGEPFADFPNTDCDITEHFGAHNLIINLTFCGDWAGAVFSSDGCPGDCTSACYLPCVLPVLYANVPLLPAYVDQNPSAFSNAYFDIASLNIYE